MRQFESFRTFPIHGPRLGELPAASDRIRSDPSRLDSSAGHWHRAARGAGPRGCPVPVTFPERPTPPPSHPTRIKNTSPPTLDHVLHLVEYHP
eukprot:427445-Hanusia_phi.AAC.2